MGQARGELVLPLRCLEDGGTRQKRLDEVGRSISGSEGVDPHLGMRAVRRELAADERAIAGCPQLTHARLALELRQSSPGFLWVCPSPRLREPRRSGDLLCLGLPPVATL